MSADEEEEPPLGISREQWRGMLADVRKREIANKKRSETLRAKAAARKAAELSQPPRDLDEAWRRHADQCPHPAYSTAARTWFREHPSFEFDGTSWTRKVRRERSNSGKTMQLRSIVYHGADGRTVTAFDDGPNRRNDPDRDWGLPD